MNKETFQQEVIKLKDVVQKVSRAKSELSERLKSVGKENLDKLKDLRENPETSGLDFFMFLEQIHQENRAFNLKEKFKMVEELDYLEDHPYFARIDLSSPNGDEVRKIYIGKFGYTEDEPIVTDWRAKIASVYYRYRYPQKNVKYETPDGEEVRDLNLKRTYEIDEGSLIKYYNNDLQLDESEIIAEKLDKRTGGVLEDIVESIQASQLDIIEEDPRKLCLVQGCVGSGKSTVAIHKLSHIFFNYPDFIRPHRSILVAKNHVLVGYLSTLFPKLGIFDINYKTIKELIINLVFREELGLKINYDQEYVSPDSKTIIKKLEKVVSGVHQKYENKIRLLFENEEFETFGGYKYTKDITPLENVTEIIDDLDKELKTHRDYVKERPKSLNAVFYKENIKTLKKIITRLKKMRLEIKNDVIEKELSKMGVSTSNELNYEGALMYIYMYLDIIGLTKFKKYEYCVVDEGQDISLLEYSILSRLVLYSRMCILGDLNQGYNQEGIQKWEMLPEVMNKKDNFSMYTLDTNYRSTKQIIEVANKILDPFTQRYLPKSINRVGEEPEIQSFENDQSLISKLKSCISEDAQDIKKSVGIISFDEKYHAEVGNILNQLNIKKEKIIELREDKNIAYVPKGIYYTNFENCRGLEFSKVYVLGLNPDNINNEKDAKKAFIAVTRAMNELKVYYTK